MTTIKANLVLMLCATCLSVSAASNLKSQSQWRTDKDGWVLRKAPGEKQYKKFFATGLWNVPGYTRNAMEENTELYRSSAAPYLEKTSCYNMVYLPPSKDALRGKRVEINGSVGFYEALRDYQAHIPGLVENKERDYQARHYVEQQAQSPDFLKMLDEAINRMIVNSGQSDHIWAPIDEIVGGGAGNGWCWSPKVGRAIKQQILKREPHTLVYTDLVGISRGNSYLFERNYLQTHGSMPSMPPYDALGPEAKRLPERPLLGFVQAYDGSPIYVNGTADYTDYDLPTLRRFFYENLKICAADFRGCGDVFGINSFIDCNTYPELAGVAVDGIKAGVGSQTPVWIFFDGNGYAQPAGQDVKTFVQNLKCQMYTSIIHGATGVMFWNDRTLSPDVFNGLEPVVAEIEQNVPLFEGKTMKTMLQGSVQWMIKQIEKGKRVLIAANTSPSSVAELSVESVQATLQPYEVKIVHLP